MNGWGFLLKCFGWKTDITVAYRDKVVICVAPHTSNWDFIIGLLAYRSMGRKANFLMKEFWFFFPLKYILKGLGGIPVPRRKKGFSLTDILIKKFNESTSLNLAITPEGTRSATSHWHTGFLHIALQAKVPIQLGVIDYAKKIVIVKEEFYPDADIEKDMQIIKNYFSEYRLAAKYPQKFII